MSFFEHLLLTLFLLIKAKEIIISLLTDPTNTQSDLALLGRTNADGCSCASNGTFVVGCRTCGVGCVHNLSFSLVPHYYLYVSVIYELVDTWDYEGYYLYIDNVLQYGSNAIEAAAWNACREKPINVQMSHSSLSLNILMKSGLDQVASDESFGYTALQIWLDLCPSPCLTCQDSTTCLSCLPNSYLYLGNCLCSPGYFLKTLDQCTFASQCTACEPCESDCMACSDSSTCTQCFQSLTLSATLDCECAPGTYPLSIAQCTPGLQCTSCQPCPSTCQTCTSQTVCTSCYGNSSLGADFQCHCLQGFFYSLATACTNKDCSFCEICDNICANCDSTRSNCQSCFSNAILSATSEGQTCVCRDGFYFSSTVTCGLRECSYCNDCGPTCQTCAIGGGCATCFGNATIGPDLQCHCLQGFFLAPEISFDNRNITRCDECENICESCTSNRSNCQSCFQDGILTLGNEGQTCVCRDGFYFSNAATCGARECSYCSDCGATCQTCGLNGGCATCFGNATLGADLQCHCLQGFFLGTETQYDNRNCAFCEECDHVCQSCSLARSQCDSCFANANLSTSSDGQTCVCQDGFYLSDAVPCGTRECSYCKDCGATCQTCTVNGGCATCFGNATLQTTGLCECNDGFYADFGSCIGRDCSQCFACNSHCLICDNSSANSCLDCFENAIYDNSLKTCTCEEGFFFGSEEICGERVCSYCNECGNECRSCDQQADICLTCYNNAHRNTSGRCVCDDGFFMSESSSLCVNKNCTLCMSCPLECETCSSSGSCLTCPQNSSLLSDGHCLCDVGFYTGASQDCGGRNCTLCKGCGSSCSGCNNADLCTSCYPNATLSNGVCICDAGYYRSAEMDCIGKNCSLCQLCSENCQECTSYNSCTLCYPHALLKSDDTCSCGIGFYPHNTICEWKTCTLCGVCDPRCASCQIGIQCDSCFSNARIGESGFCECLEGFYLGEERDCDERRCSYCEMCHWTCKTCSGEGSDACLECYPGFELVGTHCEAGPSVNDVGLWDSAEISMDERIYGLNGGFFRCRKGNESRLMVYGRNTTGENVTKVQYLEELSLQRSFYQFFLIFAVYIIDDWSKVSLKIQFPDLSLNFSYVFDSFNGSQTCVIDENALAAKHVINTRIVTNSSLKVLNFSIFAENNESKPLSNSYWGIRDISLYKSSCHESCATCYGSNPDQCLSCYPQSKLILSVSNASSFCQCIDGFYLQIYPGTSGNPSSVCKRCHEFCSTCFDESETSCLTCSPGFNISRSTCFSENVEKIQEVSMFSPSDLSMWTSASPSNTTPSNLIVTGSFPLQADDLLIDLPPHYAMTFSLSILLTTLANITVFIDNNIYPLSYDIETKEPQNMVVSIKQFFRHSLVSLSVSILIDPLDHINPYNLSLFNSSLKLVSCHESCLECSGPEQYNCEKCHPFASKLKGQCFCDEGSFAKKTLCNGIYECVTCQLCHPTCAECDGEGAKACISCANNRTLLNKQCLTEEEIKFDIVSGEVNTTTIKRNLLNTSTFYEEDLIGFFYWEKSSIGARILQNLNNTLTRNQITNCPDYFDIVGCTSLFGQQSISVTRIFSLDEAHHTLNFQILIMKFTMASFLDQIRVFIDSQLIKEINADVWGLSSENFCVNRSEIQDNTIQHSFSYVLNLDLSFPHNDSQLNLTLECEKSGDSIGENWGFRDIQFSSFTCHFSCLSCNGPSNMQCLSCDSSKGFYYLNGSCFTTCPLGTYGNNVSSYCETCDLSCLSCVLQTKCTSCNFGQFLYRGICQNSCPQGTFEVDVDNSCKECHESCFSCFGPSYHDCIQCNQSNAFLDSGVCKSCDPRCKSCSGPQKSDCETCNDGTIFFKGQCLEKCPSGFFLDSKSKNCEGCYSGCESCFGAQKNECLSCVSKKVLTLKYSCESKCETGSFNDSGYCELCDEKCFECSSKGDDHCLSCKAGYFLHETLCFSKPTLNIAFSEIENPHSFSVNFGVAIMDFFEYIEDLVMLSIESSSPVNFKPKYTKANDDPMVLLITLDYSSNLTNTNNYLSITIQEFQKNLTLDLPYNIPNLKKYFKLNEIIVCDGDYYINQNTCVPRGDSTPIRLYLRETSDSTIFKLLLLNADLRIYHYVTSYAVIHINGLLPSMYSYKITQDQKTFSDITISLQYFVAINSKPKMKVSLDFPSNFLQSLTAPIIFVKDYSYLSDYYELNDEEKAVLQASKQIAEASETAYPSGLLLSLIAFPSFGAIKIMMLSKVLVDLRYINLNYPRIMQEIFKENSKGMPLLLFNFYQPDNFLFTVSEENAVVDENKDPDDIFSKYGIKLYFLTNFGEKLTQVLIAYAFAELIYRLKKKLSSKRKIAKLFNFLETLFVWGWLLGFIISNFQKIVMFLARSWLFTRFSSVFGKVDLFVGISISLLMARFLFIVSSMVIRIPFERKKLRQRRFILIQRLSFQKSEKSLKRTPLESPSGETSMLGMMKPPQQTLGSLNLRGKLFQVEIQKQNSENAINMNNNQSEQPEHPSRESIQLEKKSKILERISIESPAVSHGGAGVQAFCPFKPPADPISKKMEELISKEKENLKNFKRHYGVLYKGVKRDVIMRIFMVFIEMMKFGLWSMILVFFYERPFTQITLLMFLNLYFLVYLVIYKPYKSKIKLIIAILQEIVLLYAVTLVFLLAFFELYNFQNFELKKSIGLYFSYANMAIFGLFCIGMVQSIFEKLRKKFWKKLWTKQKSVKLERF